VVVCEREHGEVVHNYILYKLILDKHSMFLEVFTLILKSNMADACSTSFKKM